jgi:hypothetical protein
MLWMENLARAQAAHERALERLAELRGERDAALTQFEGTEEVEKLDAAILKQERLAKIQSDKVIALHEKQREEIRERAEKQYADAAAEILKRLEAWKQRAAEVDAAVANFGKAFEALNAARAEIFRGWPAFLPRRLSHGEDSLDGYGQHGNVLNGIANALRRAHDGKVPAYGGVDDSSVAHRASGEAKRFASRIADARAEAIKAQMHDEDDEEAA